MTDDLMNKRVTYCRLVLPRLDPDRPWLYTQRVAQEGDTPRIIFFSDETHVRLKPQKTAGLYHWGFHPPPPIEQKKSGCEYITISGVYGKILFKFLW